MGDMTSSDHDRVNQLAMNLAVLRAEVTARNELVDARSEAFFKSVEMLRAGQKAQNRLLVSIMSGVLLALVSGIIALA